MWKMSGIALLLAAALECAAAEPLTEALRQVSREDAMSILDALKDAA